MNSTGYYDFTIIVPIYNEEDNMEALEQRLGTFLPRCREKACVLFVDDGSTDDSTLIVESYSHSRMNMFNYMDGLH